MRSGDKSPTIGWDEMEGGGGKDVRERMRPPWQCLQSRPRHNHLSEIESQRLLPWGPECEGLSVYAEWKEDLASCELG